MFIQTETTPNPNTLKFIPGQEVAGKRVMQYANKEEAANSPLAVQLFDIEGVKGVFLGSDFISVTRQEDKNWDLLKTEILTVIMEHFVAGIPVLTDESVAVVEDKGAKPDGDEDELTAQIRELIDLRVRPAVAQDGGDIVFRGFKDGVVQLELYGACSGCPSSIITLKNGIENMLKHYVPEVQSVEALNMEV